MEKHCACGMIAKCFASRAEIKVIDFLKGTLFPPTLTTTSVDVEDYASSSMIGYN